MMKGPRRSNLCTASPPTRSLFLALVVLLLAQASPATATPTGAARILRIRHLDGSVSRVAVPAGREGETTLGDILASSNIQGKGAKVIIGQGPDQTPLADGDVTSKSIAELDLRHGSLITLARPDAAAASNGSSSGGMKKKMMAKAAPAANSPADDISSGRFDPFPALAKPAAHSAAARRLRALAHSSRGQSYERISKLRECLHQVEPQPEGPVKRVYMCTVSADRFKDGCTVKPTKKQIVAANKAGTVDQLRNRLVNRMGLCFGTIGSERVDQKRDKVRTSLSTPLYEREMCGVAKVQAIWEPSQRQGQGEGQRYDATRACRFEDDRDIKRALRIADALGLRPVGWLYSYSEDRHAAGSGSGAGTGGSGDDNGADEDALPVYAPDVYYGALLQIGNMKSKLGREEGKKFVTLALDGRSGATEAFQLSDVSVQMVAEGLIPKPMDVNADADDGSKKKTKKKSSSKTIKKGDKKSKKSPAPSSDRFVTAKEKFLVDSEETTELDSVLCLVNTALLGHTGTFCGKQGESSVTKKGQLTGKTKKRILAALDKSEKSDHDVDLFEALCDFNALCALDGMLKKADMDSLCGLVKKWARGQKRGTECSKSVRAALRFALET